MTALRTGQPGKSVASRILAVLEAFENQGRSLTLSEIAEDAGLPVSTAHRIIKELNDWGALTRDDSGRYSVGLRLWELGQTSTSRLRDAVRPFLQDLFSLTGEVSHFAIREGDEALYVDRIYGSKRVPRASRIGGRLPLHATAVGKMILALEEPWFQDAYLEAPLKALTPKTIVDPAILRAEFEVIVKQRYALTHEAARAGASSMAVPILLDISGLGGQVPSSAAIGIVTTVTKEKTLQRYLPVLRGVARRIETTLQRARWANRD